MSRFLCHPRGGLAAARSRRQSNKSKTRPSVKNPLSSAFPQSTSQRRRLLARLSLPLRHPVIRSPSSDRPPLMPLPKPMTWFRKRDKSAAVYEYTAPISRPLDREETPESPSPPISNPYTPMSHPHLVGSTRSIPQARSYREEIPALSPHPYYEMPTTSPPKYKITVDETPRVFFGDIRGDERVIKSSRSRMAAGARWARSPVGKKLFEHRVPPPSELSHGEASVPADSPPRSGREHEPRDGQNALASHSMEKGTRDAVAVRCGFAGGHKILTSGSEDSLVVCSHLGVGSLGVVEEVRVSEPGFATFVRKRVQLPYQGRNQRLQIIKEEAKVLEDLCHPHIVQIIGSYEFSQGKKQFYCLLMSPVGESDLKTFLDEVGERVPTEEETDWLRSWFYCLASALGYIHRQGVRHQDIKPSNIVHRGAQILYTDFSSSARFTVGQTTSTENPARASTTYAAPEVVDNFSNGTLLKHGCGTDIFSLGCVFVEMLLVSKGQSVTHFHNSLLTQPAENGSHGPGATSAGRILIYSRVLDQIAFSFEQSSLSILFYQIIAPMIRPKREDRCDAHGVMQNLSMFPAHFPPCPCDERRWPSETEGRNHAPDGPNSATQWHGFSQHSPNIFTLPTNLAIPASSSTSQDTTWNPFNAPSLFTPPTSHISTGSTAVLSARNNNPFSRTETDPRYANSVSPPISLTKSTNPFDEHTSGRYRRNTTEPSGNLIDF